MVVCSKICVTCGSQFVARGGFQKYCFDCKSKLCPQCGRSVKHWSRGICSACASANYYAVHSAKCKEYSNNRYKSNPDTYKARSALFRLLHPDRIRTESTLYRLNNRDRIVASNRESRRVLRCEMIAAYGGKCVTCGESNQEFLCIDHISGGGKYERLRHLFGVNLYRDLRRRGWPTDNYRLLCFNCNMARMFQERMSKSPSGEVLHNRVAKAEMIEAYGGKCACCGESNYVLLSVDHINGGGQSDRKLHGRGRALYVYLKRLGYPKDGYRLLCHNCNASLGHYGYCPHGGLK
jgi:hypothetical protein